MPGRSLACMTKLLFEPKGSFHLERFVNAGEHESGAVSDFHEGWAFNVGRNALLGITKAGRTALLFLDPFRKFVLSTSSNGKKWYGLVDKAGLVPHLAGIRVLVLRKAPVLGVQ